MDEKAAKICKRLETMRSLRQPHENAWQDCYDHSHPLRGKGLNNREAAKNQIAKLLDTTSTDSARILASSIVGGMTPANSRWFEPDIGESQQISEQSKLWLDNASQILWENLHASNFDSVGFECMLDMVDVGWFGMYIEEAGGGGLFFQLWHMSELFIASSKQGAPIDTVYRKFQLTADQAVQEYGLNNVSEKIRKAYEENPDTKFDFVHAIEPRKVNVPDARLAKNLPIASYHVEVAEKKIIREGGYHEMPVVIPRWSLLPYSDYAVGPIFDALPAIKQLNQIKLMEIANLDIAAGGMFVAEDDGVLNPKTIKFGARRVIVANSVDSIKPLQTGTDFNVTFTSEEQLRREIRKILMADQLQPQDGPAMTATEVHVRVGLIRQLLGPVYGRLQAEYLQPLITRCFGLAYRAGVLGEAPEEIRGRVFSIKYISPLARAQQLESATAVERVILSLGQYAQTTGDVTIFDGIDADEVRDVFVSSYGAPLRIKRTAEDIAQLRDDRTAAQEQARAQQQQEQLLQSAAPEMMKQAANAA